MESKQKIVDYYKYCKTCKHKNKAENEDPCWDCLTIPVNEDSHKPINYEEKKSKKLT